MGSQSDSMGRQKHPSGLRQEEYHEQDDMEQDVSFVGNYHQMSNESSNMTVRGAENQKLVSESQLMVLVVTAFLLISSIAVFLFASAHRCHDHSDYLLLQA